MHRSEDTEMMGGMSMERIVALTGDTGVGRHAEPRRHGRRHADRHAPDPPGASSIPQRSKRRVCAACAPSSIATCSRFSAAATLQPTYVAVAEAPEGKADVLEVKNEARRKPCGSSSTSRRTCR